MFKNYYEPIIFYEVKLDEQELPVNVENPRVNKIWSVFDSLFRDFFFDDEFFGIEAQIYNDIPLSLSEPFVDLKELIRKRKKSRFF